MSKSPNNLTDEEPSSTNDSAAEDGCPSTPPSPKFSRKLSLPMRILIRGVHGDLLRILSVIIESLKKPDIVLYSKWFGSEEHKQFVINTFQCCYDSLCRLEVTYCYSRAKLFCYAYSTKENNTIYLTDKFMDVDYYMKLQIITHEITHLYGHTKDYEINGEGNITVADNKHIFNRVLSPEECQDLAKKEPQNAITNADNYGFFFRDFYIDQY